MNPLEHRVGKLERTRRPRTVYVVCDFPENAERALSEHYQHHAEHRDPARFDVLVIATGVVRAPNG